MQDLVQDDNLVWNKTKNVFKKLTRKVTRSGSQVADVDTEAASSRAESLTSSIMNETATYRNNIQVTFHRRELFMETFKDYYSDPRSIQYSLNPDANSDQVFKAGEGAGRSGSFFFFSHDRKFIIKTMTKHELNLMLKMLPALAEHFKQNPDSLLSKIIGVFTVKTNSTNEVHLMLMENTLQLKNPENLKYIFDLKGSKVDRKVKGCIKPSTTLKDENFLIAA